MQRGLGFALKSFLAAEFRVGVELIAELVGLEPALQEAHLVFTGEGRLDAQTFTGKTPAGVAKLAKRKGADVVVLVGALERGYQNLYDWGVTAAFSVISGPMDLETAQSRATELIRDRAHDCMSLWLAGQRSKA